MDAEYDHAGLDPIEYIGEFQVFVSGMYVAESITDLDLRRKDETFKEEVESDAEFRSEVMFFYFH
jgi:hypothetical protein